MKAIEASVAIMVINLMGWWEFPAKRLVHESMDVETFLLSILVEIYFSVSLSVVVMTFLFEKIGINEAGVGYEIRVSLHRL